MQVFVKVSLISIAALGIAACSSGGQNLQLGILCKADHSPISMTPVGSQKKMAMKPGDSDPGLPAGIYTYARADIFYKENVPQNPFAMQLTDTALANGTSNKQTTSCARNVRPGLDGMVNKTNAITDMIVCANKKILTTRKFQFDYMRGNLSWPTPQVNANKVTGEPDDAYPRDPGTGSELNKIDSTLLVQLSPSAYMVNSKVLGDTGPYLVSIQMNYKKCPAGGCPECN